MELQANKEIAIRALHAGKLTDAERAFVLEIKDYNKRQINGLSPYDCKVLRDIARRHRDLINS
jgi:hypothetical protein